jgi:hypothetical protein
MRGSVLRPLRGHGPLATPWAGHAYKANDVAADLKARPRIVRTALRIDDAKDVA